MAHLKPNHDGQPPGATGYGVATAVTWLRRRADLQERAAIDRV